MVDFAAEDGVLVRWTGNGAVASVPAGIRAVGERCFAGRSDLESVELPPSLVEIRENAFSFCSSLKSIRFSPRLIAIRDRAFRGCQALEKVALPWSLRILGWSAFQDCVSLQEVVLPSRMDELGEAVFSGCRRLTKIRLPRRLTRLGDAFSRCASLTHLDLPSSLRTLGAGAFDGCASLEEIRLPDTVERLGANCFRDCVSLRKVELNRQIEEIPDGAFANCTSLQELILPRSVTAIGDLAFRGAVIRRMVFPPQLERVERDAFPGADFRECTMSRQILKTFERSFGNMVCERLLVPDMAIPDLPRNLQPAATRGFAAACLRGTRLPEPFRTENLEDMRRRPFYVYDDPESLALILQERLLSLDQARKLVEIASRHRAFEAVTRVLHYIQENFGQDPSLEEPLKDLELPETDP